MANNRYGKEVMVGQFEATTNSIKLPTMMPVPEDDFRMGTSDEDIKRLVLKESDWAYEWSDQDLFASEQPNFTFHCSAFELGQHQVTNAEYHVFIIATGYRLPRGWVGFRYPDTLDNHPVVGVSKKDAEAYINWINGLSGKHYRLPTEEEWEYACRGNDGRIFPWGNIFDPWRCNTSESERKGTTAVDYYSPSGNSPFGVMDMVGNVWEWTSSIFRPYPHLPNEGLGDPTTRPNYVIRGGSWYYSRKLARSAAREAMQAEHASAQLGFRLAQSL
jgi:toxoflavin biosynthesis protein ToxD